jgi:hypothetical protein
MVRTLIEITNLNNQLVQSLVLGNQILAHKDLHSLCEAKRAQRRKFNWDTAVK